MKTSENRPLMVQKMVVLSSLSVLSSINAPLLWNQ